MRSSSAFVARPSLYPSLGAESIRNAITWQADGGLLQHFPRSRRITSTLVASSSLRDAEENASASARVRRFIGVCFYRVCAGCCYARNVFNFSEPRNHIARMHVQPCAPSGGRYRGEYSGYNGCCEHLRFSACETSSLSTLKSPRDGINGDNRWTERDISSLKHYRGLIRRHLITRLVV